MRVGSRPDFGQSLVGLKGYVTNVPATVMPAGDVIARYNELWRVERSFRMSQSDLRARPMFHRTRDAIEAHLTIVVTALAVAHNIQERIGLAIAKVVKQLRPTTLSDHRHQRNHRDLPTRGPRAPTTNSDQPQHPRTGALSQMS